MCGKSVTGRNIRKRFLVYHLYYIEMWQQGLINLQGNSNTKQNERKPNIIII